MFQKMPDCNAISPKCCQVSPRKSIFRGTKMQKGVIVWFADRTGCICLYQREIWNSEESSEPRKSHCAVTTWRHLFDCADWTLKKSWQLSFFLQGCLREKHACKRNLCRSIESSNKSKPHLAYHSVGDGCHREYTGHRVERRIVEERRRINSPFRGYFQQPRDRHLICVVKEHATADPTPQCF